MKYLTFLNTLFVMFYIALLHYCDTSGIMAVLTVLVFAFGLLNQLILAGIFRPTDMSVRYAAVTALRLIIFITVPLQNNIWLHMLSSLASGANDLYQCQTMSVAPAMTGAVAVVEKHNAKELYTEILYSALIIASLAAESFIWIPLTVVAVYIIVKNKKFRIWRSSEILSAVLYNLAELIFSVNLGNYIIFISLILLCSAYFRYKRSV